MIKKIKKFIKYCFDKRSEVTQLGTDDLYMGKVIFGQIYAKNNGIKKHLVPLKSLKPIHSLDRENSLKSVAKRVKKLKRNQKKIREHGVLDQETLDKYIPSVSGFRAVKKTNNTYYVFEGNGRLEALKQVFDTDISLKIAIEEYCFDDATDVIEGLENIRTRNGLNEQ